MIGLKTSALTMALLVCLALMVACTQTSINPAEARATAREAYIYGFPLVDSYRIEHAYFVDEKNPEYKAPWNRIFNMPRVYTPDDKAVQTPNSDPIVESSTRIRFPRIPHNLENGCQAPISPISFVFRTHRGFLAKLVPGTDLKAPA